jgi:copper oxidase (laccase) domain-containing protein
VVEGNRAELIERLALPSSPRWLRQVHGTHVAIEPGDDEPEADAAVTRTPGSVLAILTADCMPVVFAARDGGEIGGRARGLARLGRGVLEATLDAMRTPRERIVAWLGPAAGPQSYEIGAKSTTRSCRMRGRGARRSSPTREGHWRVDLYALARQRLARAGVMDVHGGGWTRSPMRASSRIGATSVRADGDLGVDSNDESVPSRPGRRVRIASAAAARPA